VFSNITGNRTMQEMVALADEMAQRIAYDTRDWTMLQVNSIKYGSEGTAEALGSMSFPLHANFKRLLLTSNVRTSSSPSSPMRFVPDHDEWLQRRIGGTSFDNNGEWIIIGGRLYIHPAVADDVVVSYIYLDKNCVTTSSGGRGDHFMSDNDSFALDERLLKLGMTYQWKAQKGSSYAEDMSTYGDALAIAMGHDQPAPILIDRKPISAYGRTTMPTQTIYVPAPVVP